MVPPVLLHWRYHSLAPSHQYNILTLKTHPRAGWRWHVTRCVPIPKLSIAWPWNQYSKIKSYSLVKKKNLKKVLICKGSGYIWKKKACKNVMCYATPNFILMSPKQNCRHFADDICKCILLNEDFGISIKLHRQDISGLINSKSFLVHH